MGYTFYFIHVQLILRLNKKLISREDIMGFIIIFTTRRPQVLIRARFSYSYSP